MNKIIFHYSPPAFINIPSPSLSILKGFLDMHGYESKVIYWNILFYEMQKHFLLVNVNLRNDQDSLLLFLNYIAYENKDHILKSRIKTSLISRTPDKLHAEYDFYEQHMMLYKQKVDEVIDSIIKEYDFANALYFGFSLKFEQWVFAYMLSIRLKKEFPNIPIVIGGINHKNAAESFLYNFNAFDIAMWGEGEYSLLSLTKQIESEKYDLNLIPNIAYRREEKILFSDTNLRNYVDLSLENFYPVFTDYLEQKNNQAIYDYALTLEFSRGCHWNKCHFCYLNVGYKYRRKSIDKIKKEILYFI